MSALFASILVFVGDWWWLCAVLPLAALSGWLAATRGRIRERSGAEHLPDAWRGLNFLLNEQPDKAIDLFINSVEICPETVEMHLVVGSLFRRHGEVERAIRIHQNLLAWPRLKRRQRVEALYALGEDYLKTGFLGHAENLFLELVHCGRRTHEARKRLIEIYELEKEWKKAIEMARGLGWLARPATAAIVAHYHCELADGAFTEGRLEACRRHADEALATDHGCVRATILLGRVAACYGSHAEAIRIWRRIEEQDIRYIGETVHLISGSYQALGDNAGLDDYLQGALHRHRHVRLMVVAAERIEARRGPQEAARFLVEWLRKHPSLEGLARFLELRMREFGDDGARRDLGLLHSLIADLLEKERNYACGDCGYTGSTLYWQCPRCKHWGSLRPSSGLVRKDDDAPEHDTLPEGLHDAPDGDGSHAPLMAPRP